MRNLSVISSLVSILGLLAAVQPARAESPVSSTASAAREPQIAYANGILHALDSEGQTIVYYRSTNRGGVWGARQVIGTGSRNLNPVLAARGNLVFAAWWSDRSGGSKMEVWFTRSTNGGVSFENPQQVTGTDNDNSFVTGIDASADGSSVHLVYWDARTIEANSHTNIFVRTNNSSGAAGGWGPEVLVSNPDRIQDFETPAIQRLPSGRVGVVYRSNPRSFPQQGLTPMDAIFQLSLNGGASFFPEGIFVSAPRPQQMDAVQYPNLASDSQGVLHAVWFETRRGRNVFHSRSTDGGILWSEAVQISNHTPDQTMEADNRPGRPSVVTLGNRVEIFWVRPEFKLDVNDAGGTLFRATSSNGGATWGAPMTVGSSNRINGPAAATDGTDIFVLYSRDPGDGRLAVFSEVLPGIQVPLTEGVWVLLVLAAFGWLLHRSRKTAAPALAGLALLCVLAGPAAAQQKLPMQGGDVNDLYRSDDGTTLAATNGGGVYRSSDDGVNWAGSSTGLGSLYVYGLAGDGDDLVLAGTERGIYRSVDGGRSWDFRVAVLTSAVLVVPGQSSLCFAATRGAGVLISQDGGVSWSNSGLSGLGHPDGTALAYGGGRLWLGTSGGGVYVSTDNGGSWQRRMGGLEAQPVTEYVSSLAVDPANADTVYFGALSTMAPASLGLSGGDVFISTDAGTSWQRHNTSEAFFGVVSLDVVGTRLLAGTNQIGLYATNGAASAGNFTKILPAAHVKTATGSGTLILAGLRGGGVSRSTDSGSSFAPSNAGLNVFTVRGIAVDGATILVAVDGGIQRSTDGGQSFAFSNTGLVANASLAIEMLAVGSGGGGRFYASSVNDGFSVSGDGGATWTRRDPPDSRNLRAIETGPGQDRVLIGGYRGRLYSSLNAGQNWTQLDIDSTKAFIASLDVNQANPSQILVGTYNQNTFATNNGSSFVEIQQPNDPDNKVQSYTVVTLPSLNRQVAATVEGIRIRNTSYAATPVWTRVSGLADNTFTALAVHPSTPSRLVAAAYDSGLYSSSDGGQTWAQVDTPLLNTQILTLAGNGNTLLVGTLGDGVYQMDWP